VGPSLDHTIVRGVCEELTNPRASEVNLFR